MKKTATFELNFENKEKLPFVLKIDPTHSSEGSVSYFQTPEERYDFCKKHDIVILHNQEDIEADTCPRCRQDAVLVHDFKEQINNNVWYNVYCDDADCGFEDVVGYQKTFLGFHNN